MDPMKTTTKGEGDGVGPTGQGPTPGLAGRVDVGDGRSAKKVGGNVWRLRRGQTTAYSSEQEMWRRLRPWGRKPAQGRAHRQNESSGAPLSADPDLAGEGNNGQGAAVVRKGEGVRRLTS
jgi:hypothetical protein